MPSQRSSSSQSKRAQGGGRTANSEPRLQVFKDFNGVNFELANRFDNGVVVDSSNQEYTDQSDLQMNFMFLQNNVSVCSNKTLETRNDLITLFDAPEDADFTGVLYLWGPKLYIAKSDNVITRVSLDDRFASSLPIVVEEDPDNPDIKDLEVREEGVHVLVDFPQWLSIYEYDNKIIANGLDDDDYSFYIGDLVAYDTDRLDRQMVVPNPTLDLSGHLTARGNLEIGTFSTTCPFRVDLAYSYVTRMGPTRISPVTTFYANHPVSEWHAGCYLHVENSESLDRADVIAIEFYYSTDNAMDMLFAGRTDRFVDIGEGSRTWSFDWYGYVDATSMWPVANLIAPTENYSGGPDTTRMTCIDGRMYFWGSPRMKERLWIGGNPGNLFSVSPATGGGFVDVEPGTGKAVRHVCKYKTQSGNSIVTMLCAAPNTNNDQRYNLVEDTVSLSNEQSMRSWTAEQVAGAVGCKSFDGALVCEDGLYSINRYGLALTTMTMEYNSQIRTNYISDPIKPVFIDMVASNIEERLLTSSLIEIDGVIYMALGTTSDEGGNLDNVLFCYDIDLKAWWTYTLDVDEPILKMFHIDWQGQPEGIGIVTARHVYMLPTKGISDDMSEPPLHEFLIESGQISTQMPQQGWQYLSQLEFHFDYFIGDMTIHIRAIDMFGRKLDIVKTISEDELLYNEVVHMRIDQRLMSYVITMDGCARFRMTHFIARVYTMSNKIGQVWGFDDSISHRSAGSVHPTFKCYNDVRKALFT